MFILSYLNNRQLGLSQRGLCVSNFQLNLDNLLSKLVCLQADVFDSQGTIGMPVPPFACKFRKAQDLDLLAVATEEGNILLIDTEYRNEVIKSFVAHHNAIFDICWLPTKDAVITGAGDFLCRLFDTSTCQLISSYKGHTATVRSVDVCNTQNAIFASGSRDGNISVWDRRERSGKNCDKPSILIQSAHSLKHVSCSSKRNSMSLDNSKSSVSAVAFQEEYKLASVGVGDGLVKVWDLRKTYVSNPTRLHTPRYQLKYSNDKNTHGCTSLVFDSLYKKLYCCGTANLIYQFDFHSYSNEVVTYCGFKCNSYYVKLAISPDDQYLICGSSDNRAYIWKTSVPGSPILALPGHSAEVTSVAWSPFNATKLVTSGDDNKIFLWNVMKNQEENIHVNDNNVEASAKIYTKEEDISPSKHAIQSTESTKRMSTTLPSPRVESGQNMKSIKSFFSPVTQPVSQSATNKDSLQITSPSSSHTDPSKCGTPVASNQPRSPCKLKNDSDVPGSNMTSPSPTKSTPHGKENSMVKMATMDSNSITKSNGQSKRKASEPNRICRYHPRGCGRTRGHTRCGKKIVIRPSPHNIKAYFSPASGE
ncbi:denticleless protein homolog [Argiope bruennichi]|uniref:denticleless protein homolog n=1 Tax=Argiope bruennichi TaxID=94029 RepID=UPI0024956AB9|nr:denticleless protein homolog [Argiope bruennichi]